MSLLSLLDSPLSRMNVHNVIELVEQILLSRPLSPIERLVLSQSWLGRAYNEMAQGSGYASDYLREIGAQLWNELSEALGERVTKKNFSLILKHHGPYGLTVPTTPLFGEEVGSQTGQNKFVFPGSPLPSNSPLYVRRPSVEDLACTELEEPGCLIRIRAPRKMGKSSLLNQMMAHAVKQGYIAIYLDFQEADETSFTSLDAFLRWFCANIARQLNLKPMLDEYWDEQIGSKVSCTVYFGQAILRQVDVPLVLALNEINRIVEHPQIARDFFPMLRYWRELASQDSSWYSLRLVLVHTTEISVPLNLQQSPFNVGLAITLPAFTIAQVKELASRYGIGWESDREVQQLMQLVGGHPYLINLAFYHIQRWQIPLEELIDRAPSPSGIYRYHLQSYLALLSEQPDLAAAFKKVVDSSKPVRLDAIVAYKLESLGLIQLEGNWAQPSCELYRCYFSEQLSEPDAG